MNFIQLTLLFLGLLLINTRANPLPLVSGSQSETINRTNSVMAREPIQYPQKSGLFLGEQQTSNLSTQETWLFNQRSIEAQKNHKITNHYPPSHVTENLSVPEIARDITVRILLETSSGSGVIIGRHGDVYTVLTNEHIVNQGRNPNYTVLTSDGRTHSGQWRHHRNGADGENLDIALVEFKTDQTYPVALIGNSRELSLNERVYSAGFPNYYFPENANYVESTYSWGLRAFALTTGQVSMLPEQPLLNGYKLGYTNDVKDGMSGGPVLNQQGELVGINGRHKYILGGINAYSFTDGTQPSPELFEQMEALSWGIPSESFLQIVNRQSTGLESVSR